MEENMKNEMVNDIDVVEEVEVEVYEEPEESGINLMPVIIFGGLATLGGIAIAKRKQIKEWWTDRQIKKLEKKGYIVYDTRKDIESGEVEVEAEVYESDEE